MWKQAKKTIWQVIGALLLLAGFAGLFLPFLQGLIFILIGLFILSMASEGFRARWHRIRDSFPRFRDKIKKVEDKIENKISHWFR